MDIKNLISGFSDSTIFKNIPYRINRALFFSFGLIVVAFVVFLYFGQSNYLYSVCPENSRSPIGEDSCINSFYGSEICKKDKFKDLEVCTQEYVLMNFDTGIAELGNKPPWYFYNYTYLVLAGYIITLLINTLLYNKFLFNKDELKKYKELKDNETKESIIIIGKDGKEVKNVKEDNNSTKESEGISSNSELHQSNSGESESIRSESEIEPSKESSVETSVQSDVKSARDKADRRFRKRDNNNGVPPIN